MEWYTDIRVLPDPEFPPTLLMSALFNKFHRAQAAAKRMNIGVSFPRHCEHPASLGNILRLHGNESSLKALHSETWLNGMLDHIDVKPRLLVPSETQYRIVRRVQTKSSAARLRRRSIRNLGLSEQQAEDRIGPELERRLNLPFVQVRSSSTGQRFRMFVQHMDIRPTPSSGTFSTYGLSQDATVPWF